MEKERNGAEREMLRQLAERKSVRVFSGQKIAPEEKEAILEAAMAAPTAGNQQLYTILDITDQQRKEALAESCDNQPFIAKAEMVLIFCADFQKWYDGFVLAGCQPRRPGAGDFLLAVQDAAVAAQNAVTAAWSLGIGSCYIGDIMERYEYHRELLQLPEYVFPALMVVFGYPTQQQTDRKKPLRAPRSFIVQENTYKRHGAEELKACLGNRGTGERQSFEQWMQAFCARKYHADFSLEMSRSVAAALCNFACQEEKNGGSGPEETSAP